MLEVGALAVPALVPAVPGPPMPVQVALDGQFQLALLAALALAPVVVVGVVGPHGASEAVSGSGAAEQTATASPIKAQSTAVARAAARICNAEWRRRGGRSGRAGAIYSFSGSAKQ